MNRYKGPILSTLVLCTLFMCISCHGQTNNDLTIDKAVHIALLNNASLQLEYKRIGSIYDKTEFLQNSTFATASDPMNFSFIQNFLETLLIPMKKRISEQEIHILRNEILGKMIDVVARTKIAFHTLQISTSIHKIREQIAHSKALAYESAILLRCAGNTTELTIASKKMELERAKLAVTQALNFMNNCKENVDDLIGLWVKDGSWSYTTELELFSNTFLDTFHIERDSIQNNLALQNRFEKIKQRAKELSIPTTDIFFDLSSNYPAFNIEKIHSIKVKSEMAYLWKQFTAEVVNIQSIVSKASTTYHHFHEEYMHARDEILPCLKKTFDDALLKHNAMQLGVFELLKAKETLLEQEIICLEKECQFYTHKVFIQALSKGRVLPEKFR